MHTSFIKLSSCIISAIIFVSNSLAAEIWMRDRSYGNEYTGVKRITDVVLEGEIEKGDYEKIYEVLKAIPPSTHVEVVLRSPGGNYAEGIKIGRLLRKARIGANVPYWRSTGPTCSADDGYPPPKEKKNCTCASACSYIFLGAAFRNGTVVGLHRPRFSPQQFSNLTPDEASIQYKMLMRDSEEYLKEMNIPEDIQKRINATASNAIDFLDPNYVKKYLWGWTPDAEEWILARCPGKAPRIRAYELSEKFAAGTISSRENAELDAIFASEKKFEACILDANKQLRISGYKAAFTSPSSK
jgi:hypothetical protein